MVTMLQRFLGVFHKEPEPPWLDGLHQRLDASLEQPEWAVELMDNVQKTTRTQGRLAIKVEDVERKLEGGVADLRRAIDDVRKAASTSLSFDPVLDALDALDAALDGRTTMDAALAEGLQSVHRRLDEFLVQAAVTRHAIAGGVPDPTLFKVVGSAWNETVAEGSVLKVVRAAATQNGKMLREGAVITNRSA